MTWTPRFCKTCKRIPHRVYLRCPECFEDLGPMSNERRLAPPPEPVPVISRQGILVGFAMGFAVTSLMWGIWAVVVSFH